MGLQHLPRDTWPSMEILKTSPRDKRVEVTIADAIHCQEDKMRVAHVLKFGGIYLASDDWLYAFFLAGVVESHRAMHVAMIRHCHGSLAPSLCFPCNCFGPTQAVKKAILRMSVEMYKIRHRAMLPQPIRLSSQSGKGIWRTAISWIHRPILDFFLSIFALIE